MPSLAVDKERLAHTSGSDCQTGVGSFCISDEPNPVLPARGRRETGGAHTSVRQDLVRLELMGTCVCVGPLFGCDTH